MQFTCSIERTSPCPVIVASGPAGLMELTALAHFVAQVCKASHAGQLLVDMGAVQPALAFTDHLQFGALASSLLSHLSRIAAVVPSGYADAPAARAAQLAGLNVRTFLRRHEAIAWLAGHQDQRAP